MANFKQAIEWMKEGRRVTLPSKIDGWYCYSNPQQNRLLDDFHENGHSCELSIIEFEDTEWKIYKETKVTKESIVNDFNLFIKRWCKSMAPHLLDSDDNDGEFFREKLRKIFVLEKKGDGGSE